MRGQTKARIPIAAIPIVVFIFITLSYVGAPASTHPVLFNNCTEIACYDRTGSIACDCGEVNVSDDGLYANNDSDNGLEANIIGGAAISTNYSSLDIPNDSQILSVELIIDWNVTDSSGNNDCTIFVWNGTWNIIYQVTGGDCKSVDGTDVFNISNITTNESLIENVRTNVSVIDSTGTSKLYLDLIHINVSFLPPFSSTSFNLSSNGVVQSNGTQYTRENATNITAKWNPYISIGNALVEHNGTQSFVNYSVPGSFTENWTNYTLNFSNTTEFPLAGNITLTAIYGNDSFGQVNTTDSTHFILWGHSQANLTFDATSILNGSNVTIFCNITDANSSAGIPNHNITFSVNGTDIGVNQTNTQGIASLVHTDTSNVSSGNVSLSFSCGVFNQANIFYNTTGNATSNLTITNVQMINRSTNHSLYNRGENITLYLLDTEDVVIENVSWTVIVTEFNQSNVTYFNGFGDNVTIEFTSTNLTQNWSVYANASKEGRSQEITFNFNLTSQLVVNFTSPTAGSTYSPNSSIDGPPPRIDILNIRNEMLVYLVNVNLTCPNRTIVLENGTNGYENTTTSLCRSFPGNGVTFDLRADAADGFNNSGFENRTLQTEAAASSSPSGGGGGGGGGSAAPLNCTCTEWEFFAQIGDDISNSCGAGNCSPGAALQVRTCSPAACQAESQCIANQICIGEIDFNFTSERDSLSVEQGRTDTIIFTVENSGDVPLVINVTTDEDCCEVTHPSTLALNATETAPLPIQIHARLDEPLGGSLLWVNLSVPGLKKSKAISLQVIALPLREELPGLEDELERLRNLIQEYDAAGIPVPGLAGIEEALLQANQAISQDSLEEFQAHIASAQQQIQALETQLLALELVKLLGEYRWWIILAVIIAIITAYLGTEVLYPYYRLGKEIRALDQHEKSLVKTRVETEKQYFNRVIDEKTFQSILIEGQGKILKTRASAKTKREQRSTLIRRRLAPGAFGRWITGAFSRHKVKTAATKVVKEKETTTHAKAKGHFRNILHGAGLKEKSRHPKIKISAKKSPKFKKRHYSFEEWKKKQKKK